MCDLPVMEWSSREGGVWAGVWWCDDASPKPDADRPPYKALKSSGVLLHFRLWCVPTEFLLLSRLLIEAADRRSCDNPKRRFSCDVMPIRRLSCRDDINFESWCPLCCKLPCANAWSSSRPCCRPNRPPTKFGRSSSMSFVCDALAALKFNWRLKMAGKMLNCCCCCCCDVPSVNGLNELLQLIFWPEVDVGLVFEPVPQLPPATQFVLKSNLPLPANDCAWLLSAKPNGLSSDAKKSAGKYSLKLWPKCGWQMFSNLANDSNGPLFTTNLNQTLVWLYWIYNDFNIHARPKDNGKNQKGQTKWKKSEKKEFLLLCNKVPLCLCQHFLRKGQFTHQFNLLKYHVFSHHHQHRRLQKMSACICDSILSVLQTMHELFFIRVYYTHNAKSICECWTVFAW